VSGTNVAALLMVAALLALIVNIDLRLLRDLARTPDAELLLLTRNGWAAAIVLTFPIGPLLYLTRGKIR
jgi:hypothetical protein